MLIVDEVVDGGVVMESDPASLVQRVAVRSEDIPLGEQTVAQASTSRDFTPNLTFIFTSRTAAEFDSTVGSSPPS